MTKLDRGLYHKTYFFHVTPPIKSVPELKPSSMARGTEFDNDNDKN